MATPLNLRASLIITRTLPRVTDLKVPLTISWLAGAYRVHFESGRPAGELLALAADPGGLGRIPRTREEIMGLRTELTGALDLYGDRTATRGVLIAKGSERKGHVPAGLALATAELVFTGDVSTLKATGRAELLGRAAVEYSGPLPGAPSGSRRTLRRLVAGDHVLLREVTNPDNPRMRLRAEVTALDEGVVKAGDVRPG